MSPGILVPRLGRSRARRRGLGLLLGDPPLVRDSDAGGTTADATQVDITGVDITGENRLLLAGVAIPGGPAEADAVTLDPGGVATPLVYLAEALAPDGTKIEVWALLAPPLGTNFTLRATSTSATSMVLGFLALDDVRQTNTYADVAIATALGAESISGTVSARSTDLCIGFCAVEGTAVVTLDEGQASRYNATSSGGSTNVRGRSGSRPGAGTSGAQATTLTYTPDAPSDMALVVLAVRGTQGPAPPATLLRTTEGLMFRYIAGHAEDGFATGDWSINAGGLAVTAEGRLRYDPAIGTPWRVVRHVASATRSKRMVQIHGAVIGLSGVWVGPCAHGTASDDFSTFAASVERSPEEHRLANVSGASFSSFTQHTVAAKTLGVLYRFGLFVDGVSGAARDFSQGITRTGNFSRSSGQAGWTNNNSSAGQAELEEYYDCADRFLSAVDLPTGHKLQVRSAGETVLVEAAESAGAAQVDLLDVSLAAVAHVVVVDGSGEERKRFTPSASQKQIAGGDTYSFAA